MSEQSQRIVRRRRYETEDSTIDITTIVTPRPTREPPPLPGSTESPPPLSLPPPPELQSGFPLSARFIRTINRAAGMVEQDHPLSAAAETLTSLSNRETIFGTISSGFARRGRPRMFPSMSNANVHPALRRALPEPIVYDTVNVDETKTIDDSTRCPICLNDYEEGETCGVLPCQHNFHDVCIRPWIDNKRTCPLCRLSLN